MANQVCEMLRTAQRLLYQISGSPYRPRPDVRFDLLVRDAKCWTCDRASYGDLETEDRLRPEYVCGPWEALVHDQGTSGRERGAGLVLSSVP
jgi:hypothetical protein